MNRKSTPRKLFDLLLGEGFINRIKANIKNNRLVDKLKYLVSIE
jgi:hypothetical protein